MINSFSKSVAQQLGSDMSIHDIGRSCVIGKVTHNKSQVTFKFLSYRMRKLIMVTHMVFFISENLTKYRTELVKRLSQLKYSKQIYSYWTCDGRIYVKQTETSRKQTVNNFDDIMNFERSNQQHTSFKSCGIEEL